MQETLRQLLTGLVDYAGLFPPAGLAMEPAVRNYALYRKGDHRWILGRFVLPTGRLEEFEAAAGPWLPPPGEEPWPLSALVGSDPDNGARVEEFNKRAAREGIGATIVAVEAKAATPEEIRAMVEALPQGIEAFFEIDHQKDPAPLIHALKPFGQARAKIRTGGITPGSIPSPEEVARFLRACAAASVPMKATAGLHHPLRGSYPLTYEENSPQGTMFGFLNVFLAAALVNTLTLAELVELLQEQDPAAFTFTEEAATWRGHRIEAATLEVARRRGALSYGSCSFTEPIEDLQELSLL